MTDGFAGAWVGRTLLITGASGYVAGALAAKLSAAGGRMIRLSRSQLAPVPRAEDVVGDVTDAALWHQLAPRVDAILHLAGETSAYAAERDPAASLAINVVPVLHAIAAAAAAPNRPMLVIAGTATQVGLCESLPVSEAAVDNPVTVYDLHKLFAERHLLLAASRGDVRGCCLRLANVYGPGPNVNGAADRGVLNKVVRAALAGKSITVYGDGSHIRDYVYLDDVAEAFLAAAAHPDTASGHAFLVASGQATRLGEAFGLAAERVALVTGQTVPVLTAPWPDGMLPIEFRNFAADVSALTAATGWRPRVGLAEGIDRTISAFRQGDCP